jgi:hypothetical protein
MARSVLTLPDDIADALRRLAGSGDTGARDSFLAALHAAGWPHTSSAAVLGVSRETVSTWAQHGQDDHPGLPPVPDAPRVTRPPRAAFMQVEGGFERTYWVGPKGARHPVTRTIGSYALPVGATLDARTKQRLRRLQRRAVQLRGFHSATDPRRKASEELAKLIHELAGKGVPYRAMAEAMGVRPMTVRERLKRHGYRTVAPGMRPYRGAPTTEKENTS